MLALREIEQIMIGVAATLRAGRRAAALRRGKCASAPLAPLYRHQRIRKREAYHREERNAPRHLIGRSQSISIRRLACMARRQCGMLIEQPIYNS